MSGRSGTERYSRIPFGAATDRRLDGLPLRVLTVLGRHVDGTGWCRRGHDTIAQEIGSSRASIVRVVRLLKVLGYLEARPNFRDDGGQATSSYRLVDPDPQADLLKGLPDARIATPPESPVSQGGESLEESPPESPMRSHPLNHLDDSPRTTPSSNNPSSLCSEAPHSGGKRPGAKRGSKAAPPAQRDLIPASLVAARPTTTSGLPALAVHPAPAAHPAPTTTSRPERGRGTRLPADWAPSDTDRAYAIRHGLSPPEIDREAELFRNHWQGKPGKDGRKCDWPATWRNWVLRALEWKGKADGRVGSGQRGDAAQRRAGNGGGQGGESRLGAALRRVIGGDSGSGRD